MRAGLEFLVIGAPAAGADRLWRLLGEHRASGMVASQAMRGGHGATTATLAARIARRLPGVKLIAVLRDPIERARADHARAAARGSESRGFGRAARELLADDELQRARFLPDGANGYLVGGEYGRILGEYLRFFPRDQLHVVLAHDLRDDPLGSLRRTAGFLGVDVPDVPDIPDISDVPDISDDGDARSPGAPPEAASLEREPIDDDLRERLDRHFAVDAEVLRSVVGVDAPWRSAAGAPRARRVVYTAIAGGKDELVEPDVVAPDWDYVCFTDDPHLRSATWQVRPLELAEADPSRRARRPKVLAHRHLPEYSTSLWVDGNMRLRGSPGDFARRHLGTEPLVLFRHPDARRGVYEEGDACVQRAKDDPGVIESQLERYRDEGVPETHLVSPTGVMLRRHLEESVTALSEAWWSEIESGSFRDQLALTAVTWRHRPKLAEVDGDIRDNALVRWHPHVTVERERALRARIERAETVVVAGPEAGLDEVRRFLGAYAGAGGGERERDPDTIDLLSADRLPPVELTRDHLDVFGEAPAPVRLLNEDLLLARRLVILVRDPRGSLDAFWRRTHLDGDRPHERPDALADCPAHGIERVSACVESLLDLHRRARRADRLLVDHDELAGSPEAVLQRVLRFTLGDRGVDEAALASALTAVARERPPAAE